MRTYNKQQNDYMKAQALLETLEEEAKEVEQQFIIDNNIKNPDGSTPTRTWAIDDDELAEKAIEGFGAIFDESELGRSLTAARMTFKEAEEKLLSYALSIAPAGPRATLEKATKTNWKIREQIIEAVLKLDTRTVKR